MYVILCIKAKCMSYRVNTSYILVVLLSYLFFLFLAIILPRYQFHAHAYIYIYLLAVHQQIPNVRYSSCGPHISKFMTRCEMKYLCKIKISNWQKLRARFRAVFYGISPHTPETQKIYALTVQCFGNIFVFMYIGIVEGIPSSSSVDRP